MENYEEQQQDEIEALRSIFDSEFTEITTRPPCFMIQITNLEVELKGTVVLKFTLPDKYPDVAPTVEIPSRSQVLSKCERLELLQNLMACAEESLGMPVVFTLVDAAKTWINENVKIETMESMPVENTDEEQNSELRVTFSEPKVAGGRWDFVIGLVGKPSAGKSTFFNAAVQQNHAKTAAHPFTTIEPNISKGFYTIPCPCTQLGFTCDAAFGHSYSGERFIPVLMKDVAGLVPGACQGKGRGNRFLNDLLDADVLIHIVDVSGCTDENGEQTSGYDPSLDVAWLQQEIHQWVYDNIMAKWENIKKKPLKLIEMFTGYHASKSVIYTAFQNAGIDSRELSKLASWDEKILHRIVDSFLRLRFPIYLALNKCDYPGAEENLERIKEKNPESACLPVSAKTECELQEMNQRSRVEYQCGSSVYVQVAEDASKELIEIQRNVFERYGSTNVLRALSEAVKLRSPEYIYPVHDLDTLQSIDKYRGQVPGRLRDCVCLKPQTTLVEAFHAMCYHPVHLMAGDFIRAEAYHDGNKRQVRKDEKICEENCIVKIMTTCKINKIKSKDS